MISYDCHVFRAGPSRGSFSDDTKVEDTSSLRKQIEPWLTAVVQSEHLSLLLGNGFTSGVLAALGGSIADMSSCEWKSEFKEDIDRYAKETALGCGRGAANFEDQMRAAMRLRDGLEVIQDERTPALSDEIDEHLKVFLKSILECERSLRRAPQLERQKAESLLVSFLLSFASRAATRERLNLFTTNYDRLIEYGCDQAGLHTIDRFVGALSPVFRNTRLDIDIHYNPPGIRGEPRYLEGVLRLCKLHGSLDWRLQNGQLQRESIEFGAPEEFPGVPDKPSKTVMIYPNAAKDIETLDYPYSELFRDFAAAICRPNSALVTYGYGFGDDHVNRVLGDMLSIPSTHLVIIAWDQTDPTNKDAEKNGVRQRIIEFSNEVGKDAQISLLLGSHFGDLGILVDNYLPKPAIDQITIRKTKLIEQRGEAITRPQLEDKGNE